MNGCKGNADGIKIAYKLVDWLFNRKLMIEFTWTGSSKNKQKRAFLVNKNIVNMFYKIVNSADSKYSIHNTENFFKNNILKYSESRWQQLQQPPKSKQVRNRQKNVATDEVANLTAAESPAVPQKINSRYVYLENP